MCFMLHITQQLSTFFFFFCSRNRYSTLSAHPGFEPMLCHGDITLSFMYQATEKTSEQCRKRLSKNILQPNVDEPLGKESTDKQEVKSTPNTTR